MNSAGKQRDWLLDGWRDEQQRAARIEASLVHAIDLLTEWIDDELNENAEARLMIATRTFLLNVPIGGR